MWAGSSLTIYAGNLTMYMSTLFFCYQIRFFNSWALSSTWVGVYNTHLQWGKLSCLSCKAAPAGCVKYSISNWISRFTKGTVLTKAMCILVRFPGHLPAPSWCRFSILLHSHLKGWRQNVCIKSGRLCVVDTRPRAWQRPWNCKGKHNILVLLASCGMRLMHTQFCRWNRVALHLSVNGLCMFQSRMVLCFTFWLLDTVTTFHLCAVIRCNTILYIPIGGNIAMCVPLF